MSLNTAEQQFWERYVSTLDHFPKSPVIESSIAGNLQIADELLQLYLDGNKTAGSGLVKDYESSGDPLPQVGNFWIILDSLAVPRCIVKTVRVVTHRFDQVPEEVAIAEGEGDCSLKYWREGHRSFFTPYLDQMGINDLDKAEIVTEFFEVVFR